MSLATLLFRTKQPDYFDKALAVLLKHEGGYVNHPRDPGGMTNLGVTRRVWEQWVGRTVSESDMRSLTPAMVGPLYRKRYWEKVHADELPGGLALMVFDFGVNAGPRRAIRYLQKTVGTFADGLYGPVTRKAVEKYVATNGEGMAIRVYAEARRNYYRSLPTFDAFGRGWLKRVKEVEREAVEWVR